MYSKESRMRSNFIDEFFFLLLLILFSSIAKFSLKSTQKKIKFTFLSELIINQPLSQLRFERYGEIK